MEWTDEGIVLAARKHGERALILQLLTREHGRHAGLVHGGASAGKRGALQPGSRLQATWRARLADHLGYFSCEQLHNGAAALLDDPLRLAALASACAVAELALPEREPHPTIFAAISALVAALESSDRITGWGRAVVAWELGLLGELGFGLDLTKCAATGRNDELAFVSPRTGRAVSLSAGEAYRDRLLALPGFLIDSAATPSDGDIAEALALTGHFLERHVFAAFHRQPPASRSYFLDQLSRTLRSRDSKRSRPSMPPSS
ncbi:MAG TPA: DNA repair protein RecO [Alphaproteobacteria bacterium]|nr:DNA repair protein RecO [Alphaproteobacteria bacterium]